MRSPLLNINLDNIPVNLSFIEKYFSPDNLVVNTLHFVNTTSGNHSANLHSTYAQWSQPSPKLFSSADYAHNGEYTSLPTSAHCLDTFLEPEPIQTLNITSDNTISIVNHFHYVLFADTNNNVPIGFVKGSFSLNSALEVSPLAEYDSDLDDFDDNNTIYVGCNIEAIELSPNCRGKGYGKFIVTELCKVGQIFFRAALGQLTESDAYAGLAFEPVYTIDIHSQGGYRWSEHMYDGFEEMTFNELLNYTHPEYLKDLDYDPCY